MTIISNKKAYPVDLARGFDIVRGAKVLAHTATYEAAKSELAARKGCYLRYHLKREN